MELTSVFAEITKTAPQEDGSLLVYGKATGSDLDLDQQRCDPEWLKRAMPEWFAVGNIREQHDSKRAAGKAVEHEVKDDGHWIKATIVDPIAVAKTRAGVYTGFSIGIAQPRIDKSETAPGGVIADGKIVEISLVDRPCLPTATLTVCKSAKPNMQIRASDFDPVRMLVRVEEIAEKSVQADVEKASEMTITLAEQLSPEQVEQIAEKVTEKATDVAHLDAPAPGLKCSDCGEDGHLGCWPAELGENKASESDSVAVEAPDFDREAVKSLVTSILEKADGSLPPEYAPEQSDIEGAQMAIAQISRLIISEATEMVDNPAEDCDIQLLLSAVQALRCFIGREQEQAMGADVVSSPVVTLAVEADVEKAKYSADELRDMLSEGKAFKNANGEPSYPIGDKEDLENAIHAVGRGSGDHDAIRAYITRRAKALGASDLIPDGWAGSDKGAEADATDREPVEKAYKAHFAEQEASMTTLAARIDELDAKLAKSLADLDAAVMEKTIMECVLKTLIGEKPAQELLAKAAIAESSESNEPTLTKYLTAIVEAKTEATEKSVKELTEEVAQVKQMATPGGPSLRRTEVERAQSRRTDLHLEAARYKALAQAADDPVSRKGYAIKASQIEAEIKSL